MPYKSLKQQRAYQRRWIAKRREEWLRENGPCSSCGATNNLEIDHTDPTRKVSHNVWSWTKVRRDRELKKCRVLCHGCHQNKTAQKLDGQYRLTFEQAEEIRVLVADGLAKRAAARMYHVDEKQVRRIVSCEQRKRR